VFDTNTTLGFWVYLMTDCLLFAGLFAAYAVLGHEAAGGPTGKELFELPNVLNETGLPAREQLHLRARDARHAG
jgi:cytochrome o ubiquinol oxidase subunit 3